MLSPPAYGWKYDLPGPNSPPAMLIFPENLSEVPNHMDDIYLELPRATLLIRGAAICGSLAFFAISILPIEGWLDYYLASGHAASFKITCVAVAAWVFFAWLGVYFWRMDLHAPVDEPIRFNRARRKIYVYRFHHAILRPFSSTAWGVRVEVYYWDSLHAEFCSVYGPMGSGGLVETVSLAITHPKTGAVIDRFLFAHRGYQAEMYWAMAQMFMQQGPQALPRFSNPPRDWNNEPQFFNIARRLAPRVQWPADIDLESRTAPDTVITNATKHDNAKD